MPTYAYRCADCGHAFDAQQSFTDDALTTCPECGGTLRKVFSAVGVVFKGSGFYRTDSRGGGKKSSSSSTTSSSPSTSSSSTSPSSSSSPSKDSSSGTSTSSTTAGKAASA
ncbi:FmdB family zinc ribbon protein [Luteimicrobium subarcticum]|uniref:Putative FmdB family regulatory protein n=1 Tax=Luteimicrobium subarcticum TaxID=620910 RepID=A0A2M8WT75_9MICO|nr:FmdB family zinc ribbon protein [Luteimicrobium subarcticum]PJI94046.1 putative FmdB family regulatory protein [Luteimicrobium subarcticum]